LAVRAGPDAGGAAGGVALKSSSSKRLEGGDERGEDITSSSPSWEDILMLNRNLVAMENEDE
jgi:hypothetical protein